MDKIKEFYTLANKYCCYISANMITPGSVSVLMELLMNLYISAINLPEIEPETIDSVSLSEREDLSIRFSEQIPQFYWEVFDPFVQEDSVCGNLGDDLSDIAGDLQIGMKEFVSGKIGNAVFEWKLGLNNHWGSHVVDALRALHTIRTR